SRARIRRESTRSYTRHPRVLADLLASPGSRHETANRHRPHTQECSCPRGALAPFHGLIQRIPIGDVDKRAPAVECRQRRNILAFAPGSEEPAQGGFDKLRHCAFLPRRLTLELSHDRVVDIQGRLHMETHITNTVIWQ